MAIIIFLSCFLRLFNLNERMNFSMDQGLFSLRALEIWENKEISLIGPEASPRIEGKHFFQGPATYYWLILIMLFAGWDPLKAGVVIVIVNGLSLMFLYWLIKELWGEKEALIGILLFSFWPGAIKFGNFIWNPNFLLSWTPIFLWWLQRAIRNNNWFGLMVAGIMAGIGWQFHYQFSLVIIGSLIAVFLINGFKKLLSFGVGILIGFGPLVIFELRNNFYNLRLIAKWLRLGEDENFKIEEHYLICLIPIGMVILSRLLVKANLFIKWGVIGLMVFLGIGMMMTTQEWNYKDKIKVVRLIKEKGCENFEVAQTITGDTRGYDLRYLLKINGCQPLEVDKYPQAKKLYLISKKEVDDENVWEIRSMEKFEIMSKTIINNQIMMYELVRKI